MKDLLRKLASGAALSAEETEAVFSLLTAAGEDSAAEAQVGAYLYSTACRPLQSGEIIGAARFLRRQMIRVDLSAVLPAAEALDTCGTGGSGRHSFNTSTAAAFVCAAAGQLVAKHGNRGVSSGCGSVDVLEALGVKFDLPPEQIAACCARTGFGFMFAPLHHPATARVARIRRELGIRTIFNFLGPLVNPAGAKYQLLGVSSRGMVPVIAQALAALGAEGALVVHGEDGLDEITLCGETLVNEVRGMTVTEYRLHPRDFGLQSAAHGELQGGSPQCAAEKIHAVFAGSAGPHRDLVILNAGAALYICGRAPSIAAGIDLARRCVDSGGAREKLAQVVAVTNSDGQD